MKSRAGRGCARNRSCVFCGADIDDGVDGETLRGDAAEGVAMAKRRQTAASEKIQHRDDVSFLMLRSHASLRA